MTHPSQERLIEDAARGTLSPEVQAHLDRGCVECTIRLDSYQRILRALRRGRPPEPPTELVARVRETIAAPELVGAAQGESFLAEPLFLPDAAVALRGRRMARARRIFRAGPYEVDLASLESGTLLGQVLPVEPEAVVPEEGACILFPSGDPIVVPLERNGDFRFTHPPTEPYSLCIEGEGEQGTQMRILIEEVRLLTEA